MGARALSCRRRRVLPTDGDCRGKRRGARAACDEVLRLSPTARTKKTMRSISRQARQRALVARHHLDGKASTFAEAIDDFVVMHSSDPITPHLGLWARVQNYAPVLLDTAMPHAIWRLHAMRRTLWVAPSCSVGLLDAAVGRATFQKEQRKLLGWVAAIRSDAETWLEHLTSELVRVVATNPGIHTRELHAAVRGARNQDHCRLRQVDVGGAGRQSLALLPRDGTQSGARCAQ